MNLNKYLGRRYATKAMNGRKLSDDKRNNILESIRLAPTSLGLQLFKVIVVQDPLLKKQLAPAINNQPQVEQSDSILIFAAYKSYKESDVNDYIQLIAETRHVPAESLDAFRQQIINLISPLSDEQFQTWAGKQTYIALGFAMTSCAVEEVDSTPMEGFNPKLVDEILNLDSQNLKSSVILTLGYRDEEKDYLFDQAKVRKPMDQLIIKM